MSDYSSSLPTSDKADGSASGGTAASSSILVGGEYNSTAPSLSNGQQAAVQIDSSGRILNSDILNNSISSGNITVGTTAVAANVNGTNLSNRKTLFVTPTNGTIYFGASNAVTTSNGTPIYQGQTRSFSIGPNLTIYLIAASSLTVNIFEGS